ncbi:hypothetical protein GE061_014071 [Apolygus lucorum]|uniref:Sulfatase N-terminal domain-containing protein n=1 Tax=Apolygus lucorum TaxID=248454 RepID=A0A6A4K6C3_APOLU|nr:hypothetical protein GE061_014071 [Apolygus lucorum]
MTRALLSFTLTLSIGTNILRAQNVQWNENENGGSTWEIIRDTTIPQGNSECAESSSTEGASTEMPEVDQTPKPSSFQQPPPPHIIFILADDLGWNDVGFHGSNQIPTPNIDALAYGGVLMQNYYVQPVCTPSRSSLMTGKYPSHTGMQHAVLYGAEPRGLPLTEKLLPEHLNNMGYTSRMVGKWHLGSWKKEYLPTNRGFKSHPWKQECGDWTCVRGLDVAYDLHGQSTTDVITEESLKIIKSHPVEDPLFLYIAHAAVHSGNPYNPLCTRDADAAMFTNITDYHRKRFAGILHRLDWSVGQVVSALQKRGMLENSIIVFSTDNGGPASGFNLNAASNWPLRGVKNTPWEGGNRGAAFVWSPLIQKRSRVQHDMFHIVDWLPTLLRAANASHEVGLEGIDGIDMWSTLSKAEEGKRLEILHNIDDISKISSLRVGDWKLIQGTTYNGEWDGWYGPSGRDGPEKYDVKLVQASQAAEALASIGQQLPADTILTLRKEVRLFCGSPKSRTDCHPHLSTCLFNIKADPCEFDNVAEQYPRILSHLMKRLEEYNRTAVPAANLPVDPRGDPKHFGYTWTNWGDHIEGMRVETTDPIPSS